MSLYLLVVLYTCIQFDEVEILFAKEFEHLLVQRERIGVALGRRTTNAVNCCIFSYWERRTAVVR